MTQETEIPEDVWKLAEAAWEANLTPERLMKHDDDAEITNIARAILADRARFGEIEVYRHLKANRLRKRADIAKYIAKLIRSGS